jgi:hypothetical protein
MLRNTIVAASLAIGAAALVSTSAFADPGHRGGYGYHHGIDHDRHGYHHGSHGNFNHGGLHRHRGVGVFAPYYASCWRWVPSRLGYVKAWICG